MTIQLPKAPAAPASLQWHILVVTDDQPCAAHSVALLRGEGYSAETADSVAGALRQLRRRPADLVITDAMPTLDGIQLLARIKEMFPDTQVIVMAGPNALEYALEGMRRGAVDFLRKPFDPQDLRTLTARALSSLDAARSKSYLAQSRTLLETARLLSATTDRHVLPSRALEVACRDFQADGAVLLAYDGAQDTLSVVAHTGNSVAGWAHSVQLDEQGKEAMGAGGVLLATDAATGDCYAYAPLKAGEQTRGVLGLRRIGGPQFDEKSAQLLDLFALHLTVALEAARRCDAAAQQVSELEDLIAESRLLSAIPDPPRIWKQLLVSASRTLGAEVCAILLADGEQGRLMLQPEMPESSPLAAALRETMLDLLNRNAADRCGARGLPSAAVRRTLESFISAPLEVKGETVGLLAACSSRAGCFSMEDARRLTAMAESASTASTNRADLSQVTGLYHETLELLAGMADARCPHNDGHSSQVRTFAGQLARALGMRDTDLYRVEDGALLHDIGKIRISDVVLRKPGPLSRDETMIVSAHPLHGANMLLHAPHLADLIPIVRSHHEQFDGSGYPDGLKGEGIALGARIVALADVFDALISHRVYRPALTPASARQLIAEKAGSQFDPDLAAVFLSLQLEDLIEH
ncbi:MAG: HD domain-containing phosphohydrolase [Candidatus Brocadiia bacterium]